MNKSFALLLLFSGFCYTRVAAQSAVAAQQIQLRLDPVIEITATNTLNFSSRSGAFKVNANQRFNISVSTEDNNSTLQLLINDNNTGGTAGRYVAYAPVSAAPQQLLTGCTYGDGRTFSVGYKPATHANAALVYTATQP